MSWFLFALICLLGWGTADLFYKKSSDGSDPHSHLKITVWVGLVMGITSLVLLPFSETLAANGLSLQALLSGAFIYAPASLGYILSMVIGYAGLRYLELSIVSPVQNASGALSAVCMLIYFALTNQGKRVFEEYSTLELIGTVLIVLGVISLAIAEQKNSPVPGTDRAVTKKYRSGALALIFPILYCVFDTLGTAADGIILSQESASSLGEIDVLVLYGLTFFIAGAAVYVYLWIREKKPYPLFRKSEQVKATAAVCEQFGQIFYVYAMAMNPVIAAPMVAGYCIVSVILSRLFLKENIGRVRYACVFCVIAGILLLGIAEGLDTL